MSGVDGVVKDRVRVGKVKKLGWCRGSNLCPY